jgi:hypothetical protein
LRVWCVCTWHSLLHGEGSDLAVLSWSAGNTKLFHSSDCWKKNLQTKLKKVKDFCWRQWFDMFRHTNFVSTARNVLGFQVSRDCSGCNFTRCTKFMWLWTSVSHVVQYAIITEASTKMIRLFQIPFYYTYRYNIILLTSINK